MTYQQFVLATQAHTEQVRARLAGLEGLALVDALVAAVAADYAPGGIWSQMLDGGDWALHPCDYACDLLPDDVPQEHCAAIMARVDALQLSPQGG